MMLIITNQNRMQERVVLRAMFEARKQVFIDLLGWDLPALAGRFEVDQFDNARATYLILTDARRRHLASARLLPTEHPGILTTLFPQLCDTPPPSGSDVFEITRFCLSRDLRAPARRAARDTLVREIARYALGTGITTYTGVAELPWLRQILGFGWRASMLGDPKICGRQQLGALRIDIDADTLALLARNGIHGDADAALQSSAA
ncbi:MULTISPECIES: acyl-homoserine-lactone synthase [unclassified Sphingomonas]|uniref:acyl-homoserine-lactone synthase n=1 Tax=unclassified Sphingomonas TaxID=196159 RepID=UPI0027E36BC2|nr:MULTISPECIES: acyl-homoserine-lactone synthase [unclassified Sphingomonas]